MTQTTRSETGHPFRPSDAGPPPISAVLLQVIYGLVIPLFTSGLSPDLNAARLAAIELVQSYRPRTQPELVLVAKVVAFGLAALDNLRTSMAPDQAVTLKLRLRANAVALERLAGKNADSLDRIRSAPQPGPAHPFDPWTAADEADLKGMMENARAMIEAANADLALARAQMESDDIGAVEDRVAAPPPAVRPEPQAETTAQVGAPAPVIASAAPLGEQPVAGGIARLSAASQVVATPQASDLVGVSGAAPMSAVEGLQSGAPDSALKTGSRTPLTAQQQGKLLWADAMTSVAKEFTSHSEDADPMLRKADAMRASILGAVASELAAEVGHLKSP